MNNKFDKLNIFKEEPVQPFWQRMKRSFIYVTLLFVVTFTIGWFSYDDIITVILFSFGISFVYLIQEIFRRNGLSGLYYQGDKVVDEMAESDKIFNEIKKNKGVE